MRTMGSGSESALRARLISAGERCGADKSVLGVAIVDEETQAIDRGQSV